MYCFTKAKSYFFIAAALPPTIVPNASQLLLFEPKLHDPLLNTVSPSDQYPSSSHYTRKWDKMVVDISEEEKNEKLEGDAALNKLFQQIYCDGTDEVKRAMNKSFVSIIPQRHESGLFAIAIVADNILDRE